VARGLWHAHGMRACPWLVIVASIGCGGAAAKPDYPSLAPTSAGDAPAAGDEDVAAAPAPDPAEFAPPPSQPTGAPIAITWAPLAVDLRRTRDITHHALYTTTSDTGGRRQRTERHFHAAERIAAVAAGRPTALAATFDDGRETITFAGSAPIGQTLVTGEYRIEVGADGATVEVSRGGSGYPIGDREREELAGIYGGGELGRDAPLLAVMAGHALRVGETVELTKAEQTAAGGGEPLDVPIHLSLTGVADGVATYQFVFFVTATRPDGYDARGVKLVFAVEVATGRVRSISAIDARTDTSPAMQATSRMTETTTITY
jgi:hypothetical protein